MATCEAMEKYKLNLLLGCNRMRRCKFALTLLMRWDLVFLQPQRVFAFVVYLSWSFVFATTSHVAWAVRLFSQCGRGRKASAGALRLGNGIVFCE